MSDLDVLWSTLVESLRLVAAPADVQQASLPSFVHIPDEIALVFSQTYEMYEQELVQAGRLSPELKAVLDELDDYMLRMSREGDLFADELWTLPLLATSPHWQHLRDLASRALGLIGAEVKPPNLFFVEYARAPQASPVNSIGDGRKYWRPPLALLLPILLALLAYLLRSR